MLKMVSIGQATGRTTYRLSSMVYLPIVVHP